MYKKIKDINVEEIKIAIKNCSSKRKVILKLNCNPRNSTNFKELNAIIVHHSIDVVHHNRDFKYNKISDVIEKSYSFVDVAKNVGLVSKDVSKISTRLCKNIKKYIHENNLSTSHFRYLSKVGYKLTWTDEQVFSKNSVVSQSTVKKRFIATVKYECVICNIASWNNASLSLQLDHIDGDTQNNLMNNLRLLCPNCHSQTENFGSKNKTFKLHKKSNLNDKVTRQAVKKDRVKKVKVPFVSGKEKRQSRADKILKVLKSSSIDFSKHGWATPASKIIGVGHQHVARWMRMYAADFYKEKCFQRSTLVKLTDQQKEKNKEQRRKIKLNEYPEIKSLLKTGLSHRAIAKMYGVHHSSVQKVLKSIDIQQ